MDNLRQFGFLLLIAGFVGLIFGLTYDTSVAFGDGTRITNFGRMNDQRNILIVSGVLALVGAIFISRRREGSVDVKPVDATRRERATHRKREEQQLEELGVTFDGEHYFIREFRFIDAAEAIAKAKLLAMQDGDA